MRALPLRAALALAVALVPPAAAPAAPPAAPLPRGVFVDIDATGVIEAWLQSQDRAGGRSRATFRAGGTEGALMYCAGGEVLSISIGVQNGAVADYGGAPSYQCPAGHALAARASGELVCAPYLAAPVPPGGERRPPGLAAEILTGGATGLALRGVCLGAAGAALPAFFAEPAPPAADPAPCRSRGSSASFRGELLAGGCIR